MYPQVHTIGGVVLKFLFVHMRLSRCPPFVAGPSQWHNRRWYIHGISHSHGAFKVIFRASATTLWQRSRVLITVIAENWRNFCSHLWFLAGIADWNLYMQKTNVINLTIIGIGIAVKMKVSISILKSDQLFGVTMIQQYYSLHSLLIVLFQLDTMTKEK